MRKRSIYFVIGALALIAALTAFDLVSGTHVPSNARLLHTEPSEYAPVLVFEQYGERCMNFNAIDDGGRQTCYELGDPRKMVFEYTRMMTSALFVQPDPRSILIIGLGGATLPNALHHLLPGTTIDTVELDPAVLRVAERFFGYEPDERQCIFLEDGRAFVERAEREGRQYDMVLLDAFDVDYIPPQLMTLEFLEHVKRILSDSGIVAANSFTQSRLYERESATYAAVFRQYFNLRAGLDGNRVIIAAKGALPDISDIERNARAWQSRLDPYGIDIETALNRFQLVREAREGVEPLRDSESVAR